MQTDIERTSITAEKQALVAAADKKELADALRATETAAAADKKELADRLANAVLISDTRINDLRLTVATMGIETGDLKFRMDDYSAHGTPSVAKEMTLQVWRMDHPYGDRGLDPAAVKMPPMKGPTP